MNITLKLSEHLVVYWKSLECKSLFMRSQPPKSALKRHLSYIYLILVLEIYMSIKLYPPLFFSAKNISTKASRKNHPSTKAYNLIDILKLILNSIHKLVERNLMLHQSITPLAILLYPMRQSYWYCQTIIVCRNIFLVLSKGMTSKLALPVSKV